MRKAEIFPFNLFKTFTIFILGCLRNFNIYKKDTGKHNDGSFNFFKLKDVNFHTKMYTGQFLLNGKNYIILHFYSNNNIKNNIIIIITIVGNCTL